VVVVQRFDEASVEVGWRGDGRHNVEPKTAWLTADDVMGEADIELVIRGWVSATYSLTVIRITPVDNWSTGESFSVYLDWSSG
jgi:hypothetical protein